MDAIDIKELVIDTPIQQKPQTPSLPSNKEKAILEEECLQSFIDGGVI